MSNSNIVDNEEIKSSVKNLEDSMIDYLDYEDEDGENDGYTPSYNHDDVKTAMNYIHEFLEKIEKAENRDEALELVEEYITKLNELNEKCDYEIFETDQREFIWEIFNEAMNLKWFSSPEDEDVTEEWREF